MVSGDYSLLQRFSLLWFLLLQSMGTKVPGAQAWHVEFSRTRDGTHVSCKGRQILNHWTIREACIPLILRALRLRGSSDYLTTEPSCHKRLGHASPLGCITPMGVVCTQMTCEYLD